MLTMKTYENNRLNKIPVAVDKKSQKRKKEKEEKAPPLMGDAIAQAHANNIRNIYVEMCGTSDESP